MMLDLVMPNVRKMFVPDQGKVLVEMDLKGADAWVVAWESNDEALKAKVQDPRGLHFLNAKDLWPDHPLVQAAKSDREMKENPTLYKFRHQVKEGCHLTNYGGKARTAAATMKCTVAEAESFQFRWFQTHPGIREWHERVEHSLMTRRLVENKYGYRCPFFDRPETILPRALAWIPQSTVALTVNKAMVAVEEKFGDWGTGEVEMLLQVHDSFMFQCDKERLDGLLPEIKAITRIVIPYDDPLIIPFSISMSEISWGDAKDYS